MARGKHPIKKIRATAPSSRLLSFGFNAKIYRHAGDVAKARINRLFTEEVVNILGEKAKVAILDSKHLVTSKCLHNGGIPLENIWAPNEGISDVQALRNYGVHSSNEAFETFLAKPIGIDAMWYDSMTTIGGRVDKGHYIGKAVDLFLLQNQKPGKKCVVAITVSSRNRCKESIHRSTEATVRRQISVLASMRGFEIENTIYCTYRHGQQFGMWTLTYGAEVKMAKESLLTWQNDSSRYIGFPSNYKF